MNISLVKRSENECHFFWWKVAAAAADWNVRFEKKTIFIFQIWKKFLVALSSQLHPDLVLFWCKKICLLQSFTYCWNIQCAVDDPKPSILYVQAHYDKVCNNQIPSDQASNKYLNSSYLYNIVSYNLVSYNQVNCNQVSCNQVRCNQVSCNQGSYNQVYSNIV